MTLRFQLALVSALFLGAAFGSTGGCASSTGPSLAHAGVDDAAAAACTPAPPEDVRIASYANLMTALEGGARVRAVIRYSKCQLDGKGGPDAVGGLSMETFERFAPKLIGNPKAFVASSENHLIRLGADFVFNYARLSVTSDDTATVDVQYLNPTTYAVTVDETFACKLDDGSGTEAVSLFRIAR